MSFEKVENFSKKIRELYNKDCDLFTENFLNELKKIKSGESFLKKSYDSTINLIYKNIINPDESFKEVTKLIYNSNNNISFNVIDKFEHLIQKALDKSIEKEFLTYEKVIPIDKIKTTTHVNYKTPHIMSLAPSFEMFLKYGHKIKYNLINTFVKNNGYKYFFDMTFESLSKIQLNKYIIDNNYFFEIDGDGNNRALVAKIINLIDSKFNAITNPNIFKINVVNHVNIRKFKNELLNLLYQEGFIKKREKKESFFTSLRRKLTI